MVERRRSKGLFRGLGMVTRSGGMAAVRRRKGHRGRPSVTQESILSASPSPRFYASSPYLGTFGDLLPSASSRKKVIGPTSAAELSGAPDVKRVNVVSAKKYRTIEERQSVRSAFLWSFPANESARFVSGVGRAVVSRDRVRRGAGPARIRAGGPREERARAHRLERELTAGSGIKTIGREP
ncbi:hypothetical protein KM043_000925 [Ampulex compressa]|nr:hypothetical protein KM043_000925 [Ampulex compressa]